MPIQTANQQKITREEFLAYLRALVLNFGLTVRTYERVLKIEKGFHIHTTASHIRAEIVVLAIGAFHAPRLIDVPGEDLPHVSHYLGDPHKYFAKRLLVVGGRNSAVEAAVRCHRAGADVTISYRGDDFDPKVVKFWLLPEVRALIRDGHVRFLPRTCVREIQDKRVLLDQWIPADFVLLMTGYRQDPTLFEMLGVELIGHERAPVHDPETMETNVPGVFVAGTAVAGTPPRKVSVIVETCHVHVPRIVAAINGRRVALPDGALDD
jgi:thioredoxin reductase (NADPH)